MRAANFVFVRSQWRCDTRGSCPPRWDRVQSIARGRRFASSPLSLTFPECAFEGAVLALTPFPVSECDSSMDVHSEKEFFRCVLAFT